MERTYKWLGGIGYILSFVPYVGFAALILVAIAWIMMGSETRQTIFKAAGILMILSAVAFIFLLVPLPFLIPLSLASFTPPSDSLAGAPQLFGELIGALGALIVAIIAVAAIGVASFVVELVSHFRASQIFGVSWFKYAGWMRIAALASAAAIIPLLLALIPGLALDSPSPAEMLGAIITVLWPAAIAVILGILAIIFSAIAFFSIPEPPPPPPQYRPWRPT